MNFDLNLYVAFVMVAAGLAVILAGWAWRRRDLMGAKWFLAMMLASAVWAFFYGLELLTTSLPLAILWSKIQYLGSAPLTAFWLALVLVYVGQESLLTRRNRFILFAIPFITILLVWTNEFHQLLWINPQLKIGPAFNTLVFTQGLWYWVNTAYSYTLFVISTVLLVMAFNRANRLYREQIIVLLIFSLLVWVGNVAYTVGWTPNRMNLTPMTFAVSALLLAWGLFRYHLLDITPIAREQVVDNITSAVIVLDRQHRIVDMNRPAEEFSGHTLSEFIGRSILELGAQIPQVARYINSTKPEHFETNIPIDGKQRIVDVHLSPLFNVSKRFLGHLVVLRDITEYRQIEKELRKLSRVVEQSSNTIVITDLDGNIEYVNSTFTKVTGYTAEEAIGSNPRILKSGKHPTEFYVAMWDELNRNGIWQGELINRRKNGELYWEYSTMFALRDDDGKVTHYAAVKQDITRQKEAEYALEIQHKQEEVLNTILHIGLEDLPLTEQLERILAQLFACPWLPLSPRGGIFLMDDDTGMLRLAAQRNLSMAVRTMCAQIAVGQCLCGRAAQTQEIQFAADIDHRHKIQYNGMKAHGHYNVPILRGKKVIGVLVLYLPEGHQQEENEIRFLETIAQTLASIIERKQYEAALAEARDRALEASRVKSRLLANVSHELRTPLGAIMGYSEILHDGLMGELSEEQKSILAKITDSSLYLTDLVTDLLDQAQIEAGKVILKVEPFEIAEMVERVQDKVRGQAEKKGVALYTNIADDMPTTLSGDEKRLTQILVNLVNNALKFTESGSVSIRIKRHGAAHWAMSVTDTGPGIPAEAQSFIFDSFRQVDDSSTRRHGGAGLGLSIVKQLVTTMGGTVNVESRLGEGSTFTVVLPLMPQSASQAEPVEKTL